MQKTGSPPRSARLTAWRLLSWGARFLGMGLICWGVSLGAWLATGLVGWMLWLSRRPLSPRGRLGLAGLGVMVLTLGAAETLLRVHQIGERSRAGALSLRDQLGVYGFNVAFGSSALVLGFPEFGVETLSMGLPFSLSGDCPQDRLQTYLGKAQGFPRDLQPRLRVWRSDFPMRSPRFRSVIRSWAQSLPAQASPGETRQLGPRGGFVWHARDYFSAEEANGVPVALNSPTTTLEGIATREGEGWRLDLSAHLAVAYPQQATLQFGPFALEEGMWFDSMLLLEPYCGEYRWSIEADSPELLLEDAVRTPRERLATWILRQGGAHY